MDLLALVFTAIAIIVALVSVFATRPGRLGSIGVALALFFAGVICQWVHLTGIHLVVNHH